MEECYFTRSDTLPWVFFTFLKFYKWYQIAENITYVSTKKIYWRDIFFLNLIVIS